MTIALGADHGGFALKEGLDRALKKAGYRVWDAGTYGPAPCDYPRYAVKVAQAVAGGRARWGVLLCKSGVGMAIAANKVPGCRAVVASTLAAARRSREHNDTNVLVLGAVGLSLKRAVRIVLAWQAMPFEGGRHARRVRQISGIERLYGRVLKNPRGDSLQMPLFQQTDGRKGNRV